MCTFIVRHKILTFGLKVKIKLLKKFLKVGQDQTGGAISDTLGSTLKQQRTIEKNVNILGPNQAQYNAKKL